MRLTCVPDSCVYELYITKLLSIRHKKCVVFNFSVPRKRYLQKKQNIQTFLLQAKNILIFAFRVWFVLWPLKESIFVIFRILPIALQCSLVLNNWCKGCIHKTFIRPRHCIIFRTNTIRPLKKEVKHEGMYFFVYHVIKTRCTGPP